MASLVVQQNATVPLLRNFLITAYTAGDRYDARVIAQGIHDSIILPTTLITCHIPAEYNHRNVRKESRIARRTEMLASS